MEAIEALRPRHLEHVYDLVAKAGVDVSDWKVSSTKPEDYKKNPKYRAEWVFPKPDKIVLERLIILSVWHDEMKPNGDEIYLTFEWGKYISDLQREGKHTNHIQKAKDFKKALEIAFKYNLPIRAIINARNQNAASKNTKSKSIGRALDSEHWHIKSYDEKNDIFVVARGNEPATLRYSDQFSSQEEKPSPPDTKPTSGNTYNRDPKVRADARERARGKCEYCGREGFRMMDGSIYLETHHIIPLSDHGIDHISNVAALCADHHREAHLGAQSEAIASHLKAKFTDTYEW